MFPNLKGIIGSLLVTISALSTLNDPQYIISPVGFLQMLLNNATTASVNNLEALQQGLTREVKVRYMQRGIDSDAIALDNCDTSITAAWQEATLGAASFSKIGVKIDDSLLRQLEENASQPFALGTPATQLNMALYQTILTQINGLISKIDKNLLAAQAAAWGINPVIGSATAQNVTFNNTPTMTDGIVKLLSDYQFAEITGTPQVVGNGPVVNYDILQRLKIGTDSGGFGSNQVNVYNDPFSVTAWGAGHFGVFVPGLVSFVDYLRYSGNFGGFKGGSYFFTFPVPVQLANGTLTQLWFDGQLKYNDCPEYDETTLVTDRGWSIIISKNYSLFNAPSNIYKAGDRLAGFNGSMHYIGAAA
ncbi:MAG: hypothetical protein LBR64_10740 [Dysgonamonadaceae bacterium]|jgi:hypothetical protein|nr:hypothetical protein [Dysgonamonadaceae bacterium]